jgi:hypothetical protein
LPKGLARLYVHVALGLQDPTILGPYMLQNLKEPWIVGYARLKIALDPAIIRIQHFKKIKGEPAA